MNKQWMALLLSTGIAVTACPVPAAQMPPAEQIHGEAEETSVPVQHDDSDDRETANEFQSDTEPSQSETDDGAAGNEEAKSFCFLHRIIWVYVDFLLGFNNYLCVDFYMLHKGSR